MVRSKKTSGKKKGLDALSKRVCQWLSQKRSRRPRATDPEEALTKLYNILTASFNLDTRSSKSFAQSLFSKKFVFFQSTTKRIEVSNAITNEADINQTEVEQTSLMTDLQNFFINSKPKTVRPAEPETSISEPKRKKQKLDSKRLISGVQVNQVQIEATPTSPPLAPSLSLDIPQMKSAIENASASLLFTAQELVNWMCDHPSRRPKSNDRENASKAQVRIFVQQLGMSTEIAQRRVRELLGADLIYYSRVTRMFERVNSPLNIPIVFGSGTSFESQGNQKEAPKLSSEARRAVEVLKTKLVGPLVRTSKMIQIRDRSGTFTPAKSISVKYVYCSDPKTADSWVQTHFGTLLSHPLPKRKHGKLKDLIISDVVGVDVEKRPLFGQAGVRSPAAVIQLAHRNSVLALHVYHMRKLPTLTKRLLEDPRIAKAGVGIGADARSILTDLGVMLQSVLDLERAAAGLGLYRSGASLKSLAAEMLPSVELDWKAKEITISNWERPLSPAQLKYAVLDAWLSAALYREVCKHVCVTTGVDTKTTGPLDLNVLISFLLPDTEIWSLSKKQKVIIDELRWCREGNCELWPSIENMPKSYQKSSTSARSSATRHEIPETKKDSTPKSSVHLILDSDSTA